MDAAVELQEKPQSRERIELKFSARSLANPKHPERNEDAIVQMPAHGLAMVFALLVKSWYNCQGFLKKVR